MTAADQGQIGSPHPLLCARGTLGLWSWECGQLGLWGSGKLGVRPRSAVESKPRLLSLGWHKGSPEKALSFQASAAN